MVAIRSGMVEQVSRKRPRSVIDLFAGAGGFAEGFRQAGFRTIVANELDEWAAATFRANHGVYGAEVVVGDVGSRRVQAQILEHALGREIDAIIGGPPCQAFSQVRNHSRIIDDPRNRLYRHFVRLVRLIQPRVFVMENVVGLDNIAGGEVKKQVLQDLSLYGDYRVASRVLDAAAFGVPQNRLRILFVGVRSDIKAEPVFPGKIDLDLPELVRTKAGDRWVYNLAVNGFLPKAQASLDILLDPEAKELTTVEQAIGDLIHLRAADKLVRHPSNDIADYGLEPMTAYQRARRNGSSALINGDVPSIREDTIKRLEAIPHGGNFRDIPDELSGRYLNGTKWGPDIGRDILSRTHFSAYRKLHPNYFSWTLNTKADCVYHYSTPRALSVREFARIHSFDDTYIFINGDRHSRYRQIGNAVPPLLARSVAQALESVLDVDDRNSSAKKWKVAV